MAGNMPPADSLALPAPVWLLKTLHDLTLALHFGALHLLVGGLALVVVWNLVGHLRKDEATRRSSEVVARKLPVVTTYVINLGVPPLLFAQVLYGQALYTSSVLMAAWWFSAVFLIMGAYAILYRMAYLADKERPFWWWAIAAAAVLSFVGRLFSGNMTLMLRSESWNALYAADPHGMSLPADPTTWPRLILMFLSFIGLGALGTSLWANIDNARGVAAALRRKSALVAVVVLPAVLFAGLRAMGVQPVGVQSAVLGSPLGHALSWVWIGSIATAFLVAAALAWKPVGWISWLGTVPALGALASLTIVRDLVRDATLGPQGLDVWASVVHTNWTLVWIFLVTLVLGLAFVAWIGVVIGRATPASSLTSAEGSHV